MKFFTNINHNLIINNLLHIIANVIFIVFVLRYNDITADERKLIGNILCGVVIFGLTFNLLVFLFKIKEWYYEYLWKWFIKTELFRENYTVDYVELSREYEEI